LSAAKRTQGATSTARTAAAETIAEEIVTETDHYQNMIQKVLDTLHLGSLPELFAEAERLERENRETYLWIVENDELRLNLIAENASLEQQYAQLAATRAQTEEIQKQRL
jgi:t-SNARE complex subunit (syntaxin)